MSGLRTTWLVVALLLLTSCTLSPQAHPSPTPTWAPPVTATPTATPPPLGQLPANCPVTDAHPQIVFSHLPDGSCDWRLARLGLVAAWAWWPPGPGGRLGLVAAWAWWPPGPSVFHTTPSYARGLYVAPYGWAMTTVVWEVGPSYSHNVSIRDVSIRGEDIFDHTPLLFPFLDDTPTANAAVDPQHPNHPVSAVGSDWREWGSYLMPPKAGCYTMQVSWPTGHGDVTFAFGT
jgi:hypothetical protein